MLKNILQWFQKKPEKDTKADNGPQRAAAVLLLEVAFSDDDFSEQERQALPALLEKHTGLSAHETAELIELAQQERDTATSVHQFTRHLNEHFSLEQKIDLVQTLWAVAYSDKQIDRYEDHIIRKIADLLHLRHSEFMQCKQKAQAKYG